MLIDDNTFVLRLKTWSSRDETQPENCENTGDGSFVGKFCEGSYDEQMIGWLHAVDVTS